MNTKLYRALVDEAHLRKKVHRERATKKPTETQDPINQEEKKLKTMDKLNQVKSYRKIADQLLKQCYFYIGFLLTLLVMGGLCFLIRLFGSGHLFVIIGWLFLLTSMPWRLLFRRDLKHACDQTCQEISNIRKQITPDDYEASSELKSEVYLLDDLSDKLYFIQFYL